MDDSGRTSGIGLPSSRSTSPPCETGSRTFRRWPPISHSVPSSGWDCPRWLPRSKTSVCWWITLGLVTSASSPRSSNGRRSWVWESGSRSPGHWARRAGSVLRFHYPVARKPALWRRLCRPSIRPWPAILNTHYPARKGGSKAPTVPRPGSPSILIPSAPGCANSVSIGEATGLRAALDPDRSERSAGNARDPRRSSDRNIRATRKTISFGDLELEGILRFGLDRGGQLGSILVPILGRERQIGRLAVAFRQACLIDLDAHLSSCLPEPRHDLPVSIRTRRHPRSAPRKTRPSPTKRRPLGRNARVCHR